MSSALSRGRDCGRGNDALRLETHDCARPECGGVRARTIAAAAARAAASLVVASARRRRSLVSAGGGGRITLYILFYFFVVFFFNPSTAPPLHDRGRRLPNAASPLSPSSFSLARPPANGSLSLLSLLTLGPDHNDNNDDNNNNIIVVRWPRVEVKNRDTRKHVSYILPHDNILS